MKVIPPLETPPPELANLAERLPLRILIVEDNDVNQKVLLLLLAKLGYGAFVVSDGHEAVHSREQTFDVLLMDVQMPVLDGIQATRRIRSEWPEEVQPWIIAITASTIPGNREKCLEAGMNDYLSKPLQISALAKALERYGDTQAQNQTSGTETLSQPVGIDPTQLAILRDLTSGDVEQLAELSELFSANTRTVIKDLRGHLQAHAMDQLSQQAHSLKGSSSAMGAVRMSQLCLELEEQARAGEREAAGRSFVELEREFKQVILDLEAAIKQG